LGGAAGMFLGSKAGKAVGGVVGKGIASVKNFFGMGEGEGVGDKTKEAVSGGQPMTRDRKFFESIKDLPPGEQAQKLEEYKAQVTKETNSARSGQVAEAAVRAMLADYNKSKKEGASTQPSQKGAAGAPTAEVSKAGEGSTTPATGKTASIDLKTEPRRIGDEGWSPGEQLSDKQMSIIGYGKNMGRTYSAEVEAQYAKQKPGLDMANMSMENQAMRDSASSRPGGSMIVNNVSNGGGSAPNFVPMKANPRPESSLTRYQDRVAAY
jgi:hypothetical protein